MTRHPSPEIPQALVDKIVDRRGHLHGHDSLDPVRTALVVIDLDIDTCRREPDASAQVIARINQLSEQLRTRGGTVAFVTSTIGDAASLGRRLGDEHAASYVIATQPSGPGTRLSPDLTTNDHDLHATKPGASAFFPGRCNLHEQLVGAGIRSVLIAGAVTNICCESSARDAVELGYEVTMISDACVGQSFGLHEASLSTFFRYFGDVRPTDDALALISGASAPTASTSAPDDGPLAAHRRQEWIVLDSIRSADGLCRVELFEDPAGGYGFEHLRSDHDGGAWTADGSFSSSRYRSVADAIEVARKSVGWLRSGATA